MNKRTVFEDIDGISNIYLSDVGNLADFVAQLQALSKQCRAKGYSDPYLSWDRDNDLLTVGGGRLATDEEQAAEEEEQRKLEQKCEQQKMVSGLYDKVWAKLTGTKEIEVLDNLCCSAVFNIGDGCDMGHLENWLGNQARMAVDHLCALRLVSVSNGWIKADWSGRNLRYSAEHDSYIYDKE